MVSWKGRGAAAGCVLALTLSVLGFDRGSEAAGPAGGAPGAQESPTAAFDGTNYLVVWDDTRLGSEDVFGTRVAPSGAVVDPGGFGISTASADQGGAWVAFGAGTYLVSWMDFRSGWNAAYAARVTPDAVVLGTIQASQSIDDAELVLCGPKALVSSRLTELCAGVSEAERDRARSRIVIEDAWWEP